MQGLTGFGNLSGLYNSLSGLISNFFKPDPCFRIFLKNPIEFKAWIVVAVCTTFDHSVTGTRTDFTRKAT
jgi:hypothetical protein